MIMINKLNVVLCMITNACVILIPFLHIKWYINLHFLVPCMLAKQIPLKSKQFSFPSTYIHILRLAMCNQLTSPNNQLNPWQLNNTSFLKLPTLIVVRFLQHHIMYIKWGEQIWFKGWKFTQTHKIIITFKIQKVKGTS